MNCPKCAVSMAPVDLEPGLRAYGCATCEGHWLDFACYHHWQQRAPDAIDSVDIKNEAATDTENALICPACLRIMLKYRTTSKEPFVIDQCGTCNGVWFDGGEWELLKSQGLINKVHLFFSEHWQTKVRRELSEIRQDALLRERLGEDVFTEVLRMKQWISEQPESRAIHALLNQS